MEVKEIKNLMQTADESYVWKVRAILNGGPGSGNFGHAGIPGQRGGSASGGGSISPPGVSDFSANKAVNATLSQLKESTGKTLMAYSLLTDSDIDVDEYKQELKDYSKEIRAFKGDDEKIINHSIDILTRPEESTAKRLAALRGLQQYLNDRGTPFKGVDFSDIKSGPVKKEVFDKLYS